MRFKIPKGFNNVTIQKGSYNFDVVFKNKKTGAKYPGVYYGFKSEEHVRASHASMGTAGTFHQLISVKIRVDKQK